MKKALADDPLDHYKQYLVIDKHDLDSCLVEQPGCFYHVAQGLAFATAERDAAKLEMEEIQAKLDQELRAEAVRKDEKLTESAIQNKLRMLPKVQDAQRKFLDLRKDAEQWLALKEAFSQRSYMLKELVALYIAQRHDHAMEAGSGQARASLAEENRKAAGDARRERLKA